MKRRIFPPFSYFLLISLIINSCGGIPGLSSPAPALPTPTFLQQASPPAIIETDPPLNSVIGHQSPITFYFNQGMNRNSVESAFSGLPAGTFTWNDEATLVFTPTQPYPPNSTLKVSIGNGIQSANGFGIAEPIELSFTVSDYLRPTNLLPKSSATDVNVDAAIAVSFNQPVIHLGADVSVQPAAFTVQPPVPGHGEWINTSTYVFYPDPSMAGGAEHTVNLNPALKTVTGVGLEGSGTNAWKFTTSRPRVVSLEPKTDAPIPPEPEIKLTFNQPMDADSVKSNFVFSGTEGSLDGMFTWNEDGTVLTFVPEKTLDRGVGYILNVGADAKSKGGMTLGTDYGAVLNTYANFAVTKTEPYLWSTIITFNAPLAEGDYEDAVTVTPAVDNFHVDVDRENWLTLYVNGTFVPETDYVIELDGRIKDRWGQSLAEPFVLKFRSAPLPPALNVHLFSQNAVFVRPDEPVLYGRAVNIPRADLTIAPLSLQDFFSLQSSYENQQSYVPPSPTTLPQTFNLSPSQWQDVKLNLTQGNTQLPPGLYYVSVSTLNEKGVFKRVYVAASSQVNLTFKRGATEAFIWAVDLPSHTPVANAPVTIYDSAGNTLGSGATDGDGMWKGEVVDRGLGAPVYAMLGQPGDENFGLAISDWSRFVSGWNFGYSQYVRPPQTKLYMYSDRPIYRPGHTVYFRLAARQAFNGRYELPVINELPLILRDPNGTQLATFNAQFSPHGTFGGEFELPEDAVPGYYTFENSTLGFYFSFQVAEYRKPEINLSVDFSADEIKLGDSAQATVNAQYFFGAPAGDAEVHWSLYAQRDYFNLPNYETGLIRTSWVDSYSLGDSRYFGGLIAEGTGRTTPQGILSIDLPALPESESGQLITLEVTVQDESGFPVSARTELRVHPADFYIGLRPDRWIGIAKSAIGFDVVTVDWARSPSGGKALAAEFKQVRWEKETDEFGTSTYEPVYTPVSSSNFVTGPDGRARLSFTPPSAGTFMLEVSGAGIRAQTLIWVGGAGIGAWPDLPNQRLELSADKESYKAGDIANIFIPNPFATNSLALVSVERGIVFKSEVITLTGSGREYALPLTEAEAPNVYVSVTVLGQGNEFRQGLVNIPVAPDAQALNVQVTSNPKQAGPRDGVTFDVLVTDHQGQPVEGEFSLSVVDLAALALADPNAEDILPAFYSIQPLGIETGISLAAYSGRGIPPQGGGGGGGDGGIFFLREEFPDTAYWNPSLITNSEGRGQVTMTLPDSLTTWHVDVRGLTVDTKVGQAETQIVSTKPLLVRPVTPRFLVSGDHVLMAAVVNNNTASKLSVNVNLQSEGFVLDAPDQATQQVDVPANGRTRVEWWGTASLAETADLIFTATANGKPSLQDSTRPVWGKLSILQYASPQAFVTGGALRGAAAQQEVISLPRTFTVNGGGLDVELSPSLAGSLLSALEAMEVPDYALSAEAILSYFLPNLEVYRALQSANLNDPELTERVKTSLNSGVSRLFSLQNANGGWSWWGGGLPSGGRGGGGSDPSNFIRLFDLQNADGGSDWRGRASLLGGGGGGSDPYISAYVFFGLFRARAAGIPVNDSALQNAVVYLRGAHPAITADTNNATLDEITFIHFALSQAGSFDETILNALYDSRDRLSPSSRALLAYVLNRINPADLRVRDLISNLETSAIVTASSAHWETPRENIFARGSPIYTTSVVVYVLAQLDSANQVVFNAVRYLAAHRNAGGLWGVGHDNAWAMMALNEAMVGFGDLSADFGFDATLNGAPLASGEVAGAQVLTPVDAHVPLEYLSPNSPNLLTVTREDGPGRLYYNAALKVNRPVEDVRPLDSGMRIERAYIDSGCHAFSLRPAQRLARSCPPLSTLQLAPDRQLLAQLTLILPHDSYYVMVEDFIPAGMEILNRSLKTSQQAIDPTEVQVQYDDMDPFANGWGWWLFHEPQIRDDGILFTADYLPAGTYVLTYTLIPLQAGEYRVLPAHAWQAFFPEVQGTSAGVVFEVKP